MVVNCKSVARAKGRCNHELLEVVVELLDVALVVRRVREVRQNQAQRPLMRRGHSCSVPVPGCDRVRKAVPPYVFKKVRV